jgi:hypothetical protein
MRPGRADIHADAVHQHRGLVRRMGDQQDGGAGFARHSPAFVIREAGLLVSAPNGSSAG